MLGGALILDPESDGDRERTDLLGLADLLRDLHPREWIADANVHADQALELSGEPGKVSRATRQHDLPDAERAWLVLVVLERGHELASERLDGPAHGIARILRLVGRETVRNHLVRQGESTLRALDFGRRCVDRPRNRDIQSGATPFEDARELADASIRDREGRALVADRDHDESGGRIGADALLRMPTRVMPAFLQAST